MRTENIKVKLRDGTMGAYVAYPDKTPVGAIIAIMEIWGVNDTMRKHAHEFAEAGSVCLVPDLFWRQEAGVELSDHHPDQVQKAFHLYYEFDYDLGVRDVEDTWHYLEKIRSATASRRGRLLPRRQALLPDVLSHRHRLCGSLLRHLHRAPHQGGEKLHPLVTIHKYPGADHAFARHGGRTYSKPEADPALGLTVDFFKRHLKSA